MIEAHTGIFATAVQGEYLWYFAGRYVTRVTIQSLLSRTFTPEDGLVSPFVDRIILGHDGMLWFGSDVGLSRFDGNSFISYPRNLSVTSGMDIAPDGTVWVIDRTNKLNHFNGTEWTVFSTEDGLANDYVTSLAVDRTGIVWVGTFDFDTRIAAICSFDGSKWETYSSENGLPDSFITTITAGPDGFIWFGTFNGLYRYNGTTCEHYTTKNGLSSDWINKIAVSPEGTIWLGIEANVVHVSYDNGKTWGIIFQGNKLDSVSFAADGTVYMSAGTAIYRYGEPYSHVSEPPQLIKPPDMSFVPLNEETTFSWTAFPNSISYEVQFWSYQPDYDKQGGTVTYEPFLTISIGDLYSKDIPAWWRVRACIGDSYSQWSESWRFFTELPEVKLSTPADMAYVEKNKELAFSWVESEFTDSYEVQFSDTQDFTDPKLYSITGSSLYRNTGEGYSDLNPAYWRVRAKRKNQYSEWSVPFRYYTEPSKFVKGFSQYNAENNIHAIAFLDGYVWCGTSAGIIRWNPNDKTYMRYSMKDGIVNDTVTSLVVDSEGSLWAGTYGGVSKYDGRILTSWTERDGLADNNVSAVEIGIDGDFFAGTNDGYGLSRFDGKSWITYRQGSTGSQVLRSGFITCMDFDPHGILWIGTRFGLTRFDGEVWQTYFASPGKLGDDEITALACGKNGEVWVASRASGVSRINGETWTIFQESNSGLMSDWINSIELNKSGDVWFGTPYGVCSFDGTTWNSYTNQTGILRGSISALGIDSNGDTWAGTSEGLYRFSHGNWEAYYTDVGPVVLSGPTDMAFAERNSEISFSWISSPGAVSYEIQIADANDFLNVEKYLVQDISFKWNTEKVYTQNSPMFWRVRAKRMDNVWSDWSEYRRIFTEKAGTWSVFNTENGLINNNVTCIAIAPDGTVLAGTEMGLSILKDNSWISYTIEEGLTDNSINALAVDRNNIAWIGTKSGLSRFDGTTFRTYTTLDGLPGNEISTVAIAENDDVWIGTRGNGVSSFDGKTWTNYTLTRNNINEIEIAPNGDVWVATSGGGIQRFDGIGWFSYSSANDLPGNFIDRLCITPDGTLWASVSRSEFYSDAFGVFSFNGSTWTHHIADRTIELVYGPDNKVWAQLYDGRVMKYNGKEWTLYDTIKWNVDLDWSSNPVFRTITFDHNNSMWGAAWATHWEYGPWGSGIYVYSDYSMTFVTDGDGIAYSVPVITGNYPNPFNPSTTIVFFLPKDNFTELDIYNIMGQKVWNSIPRYMTAGNHSVRWNGTNKQGQTVSSGIYIVALKEGATRTIHRIVLLR